jgi:hypothetical protein
VYPGAMGWARTLTPQNKSSLAKLKNNLDEVRFKVIGILLIGVMIADNKRIF